MFQCKAHQLITLNLDCLFVVFIAIKISSSVKAETVTIEILCLYAGVFEVRQEQNKAIKELPYSD